MSAPSKLVLINPSAMKFNLASQGFKAQPLNLAYLAAVTPSSWDVRIIDEAFEEAPSRLDATLVGITTLTATTNRAYELATMYRRQGLRVVLGGIHASMVPDEAEHFADSVVTGEAEEIFPQVLEDAARGQLKRRYTGGPQPFKRHLVPRRALLSSKYDIASIQTSRGCPLDCEFCTVKAFSGRTYRQREVDDVLGELESIPQRLVFFMDDNLVGYGPASQNRAKEIFRGMIKRRMNKLWFCQTSLNFGDDEELLSLAAQSGCVLALVGLESVDEGVLWGMNKRLNAQRGTAYYYDFIAKLHRHKIMIMANMILGNDQDTEAAFGATANFIAKSGADVPWPGISVPYPGTKLYERLKREGRLRYMTYPDDWGEYNSTIVFQPNHFTPQGFYDGLRRFMDDNYSFPKILGRAMRTLAYSRSPLRAITVYQLNSSLRRRFRTGLHPPRPSEVTEEAPRSKASGT